MQSISIAGNVANPETKAVNGKRVCNFSVAVNTKSKGQDKVTWYRCAVWLQDSSRLDQYIHKGDKIAVSGELDVREYNGKTYLEIPFARVTLMGAKKDSDAAEPSNNNDDIAF
jgi:single-strand DNA-binding protein